MDKTPKNLARLNDKTGKDFYNGNFFKHVLIRGKGVTI